MTATVAPRPARANAQGAYDRAFYSGMAILMALTVFVGFAPTFYLRSYFGAPVTDLQATTLSPLVQVHGAVFTAWVLLFIAQTALVATRRVAVHRRLGIAGAVLAAVMVVVGLRTAIATAARGAAPPGIDPLVFLIVPTVDMMLFAGFVVAAIRSRRNKEAHKRLMLLAYVSIIVAAVSRVPGAATLGELGLMGLTVAFVVLGIIYDFATRRRVHPIYLWGGALIAISFPARMAIGGTAAWRAFAELLV
jgi:hypothetical protein